MLWLIIPCRQREFFLAQDMLNQPMGAKCIILFLERFSHQDTKAQRKMMVS